MKNKLALIIISICICINHSLYSQNKTADTITFNCEFDSNIDKNTVAYKCNDFVLKAIPKKIYLIKNIRKNYKKDFEITKEPMPNMHNETIIDTIYRFTNKKNKISVYKSTSAEFVYDVDVQDKKFLFGKIHTGISKDDFKKKFRLSELPQDNVIMSDSENKINNGCHQANGLLPVERGEAK
jgi:hypothetical protein